MSEKITVVVWAKMSTFGSNAKTKEEIEIDKLDYDAAKDKDEFLQGLHDEYITNLVASGVYIKEE